MTEIFANVDGDILKYKAGFASQRTQYTYVSTGKVFANKTDANEYLQEHKGWQGGPGVRAWMKDNWKDEEWLEQIVLGTWKECAEFIDDEIENIKFHTGATKVRIFLTPSTTFRHRLAFTAEYKANRSGQPKPEYAEDIVKYLKEKYDAITACDIEADDLLGMCQTTDTILCTNDKDLKMIPGKHFNFTTNQASAVTPYDADKFFLTQLLSGDATDNIPGVPDLTPARAAKIVEDYEGDHLSLIEAIKEQYAYSYGADWKEVMEEQAALLWILRAGESIETAGWRKLLYGKAE
jgi:hypothetical protein